MSNIIKLRTRAERERRLSERREDLTKRIERLVRRVVIVTFRTGWHNGVSKEEAISNGVTVARRITSAAEAAATEIETWAEFKSAQQAYERERLADVTKEMELIKAIEFEVREHVILAFMAGSLNGVLKEAVKNGVTVARRITSAAEAAATEILAYETCVEFDSAQAEQCVGDLP